MLDALLVKVTECWERDLCSTELDHATFNHWFCDPVYVGT